jgi:hypothetical protein
VRLDGIGTQATAAPGDDGVDRIQRGEVPVGDRLVDQRPEAFGRLQFRAVGRGRNTKLIPSGTARPSGPCQPALSSTRTVWRSRPAPVFRAKLASRASKKGFERPVARYHTVSPLVGCTKATTCSH